ncbi:MAG: ABC transporter substrate-binding protein [Actinomycetota bacterium]
MNGKVSWWACIALLTAACSQGGSAASDGTVVFQFAGEAEETAIYRQLISTFEETHPDIDVRAVPIAEKDEHLQKLATSFAGGNPPDVFLVNFREYSQFVARGAIEPVEPHLDEAGIDLADYYEAPVEAFTYEGTLQCMPQNVSSLVVYYNEDLLDRAGLSRPQEGWDWEEFRRYALALNDPADGVRGLGIEPNVIRLAPFVWSNGGDIVDDLETPSRFTLDTPEAREAIGFLVGLVREDEVVPTEDEISAQDLETRFVTGKLGMRLSSRRETPFFRESVDLRWDVAPLPVAEEPAGILHSDAYCIASGSDALDAAVTFLGFALGEQGQTITAVGGRTVPSLVEVSESAAFLNPGQAPRHSDVFLEGISHLRRTPVIPTWPEIEDVVEEILTRVFYDPAYDVDRGLQEIDAQTRPLFEEGTS